ncbi:MAG: flavin reductase family protein [Marivibrio sp.]|uniref:flavin reductase family protein n=1 Tax=Marivibrio sp. TaxID=2039719 RepID=UPI0032ED1034
MSDSLTDEGITEAAFKAACGRYATGVSIVTAAGEDGKKEGLTVNSFTSLSLEPPLVLFCLDKNAGSFEPFVKTDRFAVNVLSDEQAAISTHFAKPGIPDKFAGIAHRVDADGLPLLDGVLARIVCGVEAHYDGGDHVILVGRVERIDLGEDDGKPLVYFRGGYGKFSAGA